VEDRKKFEDITYKKADGVARIAFNRRSGAWFRRRRSWR
jgi:1,4-dihydroxy-2-naphthoyl-CoA synthase